MVSVLPSQLTKEDLQNEINTQLQHGGITFCIKYIGNITIGVSMNMINATEQNAIGRTCMLKLIYAAKNPPVEVNSYAEYFTSTKPEVFKSKDKNTVDMNISSKAIMILDEGITMVYKFMIQDISLVVPGVQDLAQYFTIFANTKNKDGAPSRRCFVFRAEQEMHVICKTISAAFNLLKKELGLPEIEPKPMPKARTLPPIRDKTPTPATPSSSKSADQATLQVTPESVSQLSASFGESYIGGDCRNKKRIPSRSTSRSPLSSASSSKSIIYAVNESNEDSSTPQIRVEMATPNGLQIHEPPPLPPRSRNNSAILTTPHASPQRNELIRRSMPITKQDGRRPKPNDPAAVRERTQSVNVNINKQQFEEITRNLAHEPWFHGKLNRATAESFIIDNGQFLVRQSPNISGQIVLSGMQNGIVKHICLVDQEGCLRTSEGEFGNVSQLIKYYYQQRRPVTSDSSELTLLEAVYRRGIRRAR